MTFCIVFSTIRQNATVPKFLYKACFIFLFEEHIYKMTSLFTSSFYYCIENIIFEGLL